MKERITYILPEDTGPVVSNIKVGKDSLALENASQAYAEHRITLGLSELPEELRQVLENSHEIHVRWQSLYNYRSISPFLSRLPSGLHVFYTPLNSTSDERLCNLLRDIFDPALKCSSVEKSFSRPPLISDRFASVATYQFHRPLRDLKNFSVFLSTVLEAREPAAADTIKKVQNANYLDFDYDTISHAVSLTAFWSNDNPFSNSNVRTVKQRQSSDRVEVGILSPQKPDEPEEMSMGGYLTVIGDDERPSATSFSFPSRHHTSTVATAGGFRTMFQEPTGLHPKMKIQFTPRTLSSPGDSCALHAYMTLPSSIFLDKYQLADALFLESQHLRSLRTISGEQDLEAPEWVTRRWGSAALLQLALPSREQLKDVWEVTIPLHLRYLSPANNTHSSGHDDVEVPWPSVFWACEAEEGLKMSVNPFDRTNLGFDGLFGPKTMFYHIQPAFSKLATSQELASSITVPTIDLTKTDLVSTGTIAAVALGFFWVLWKLASGFTNARNDTKHKVR